MQTIREIVYAEAKKISNQKISDSSPVSSLGIDSFDLMVIITNIEEKFKVQLSDEQLKAVKTIGDVIASLEQAVAKGTSNK